MHVTSHDQSVSHRADTLLSHDIVHVLDYGSWIWPFPGRTSLSLSLSLSFFKPGYSYTAEGARGDVRAVEE